MNQCLVFYTGAILHLLSSQKLAVFLPLEESHRFFTKTGPCLHIFSVPIVVFSTFQINPMVAFSTFQNKLVISDLFHCSAMHFN
jgi:hypothetical protein